MDGARPHRRREGLGSSAWTMSVDLVHMPKSKDLATKRIVKYALVATALVPVMDSPPGDEGKEEKVPSSLETVDGCWGEGLDEESFSLDVAPDGSGESDGKEKAARPGVEGCESKNDVDDGYVPTTDEEGCDENMCEQPPKAKGSGNDPKMEPLDPGNLLEREVRELSKPLKVRHVTLMEPVESRNVNQVISAMNLVLTKMHFLGAVVNRIHSDRAKELLSHKFQSWVNQRNILHSFTAGDDPRPLRGRGMSVETKNTTAFTCCLPRKY